MGSPPSGAALSLPLLPNRGDTSVFELEHVGNGGENVGLMMGDEDHLHALPRKLVEQREKLIT